MTISVSKIECCREAKTRNCVARHQALTELECLNEARLWIFGHIFRPINTILIFVMTGYAWRNGRLFVGWLFCCLATFCSVNPIPNCVACCWCNSSTWSGLIRLRCSLSNVRHLRKWKNYVTFQVSLKYYVSYKNVYNFQL